jgi:putative membrane protein (TIGR04086 family)
MGNELKKQGGSVISGVLIAYAITCVIFIGYAILLTYSNVSEKNISLVVTITCIISVIVAGFDASRGAAGKGWLWGMIAGALYAVILCAIMMWVQKTLTIDSRGVTLLILSLAGGGLGGIIGINMK